MISVPRLNMKQLGIPKDFGPDNFNQTNRDPEVFRERARENYEAAS